jgi:hypothetical protein
MIAGVLDAHEIAFEVDDAGFFNVAHGSTSLVIEVFSDHQLGLMVDFRAILAENVDPGEIPAEAGLDMLAMNWSVPMGAIALDAASGTLWFSYRIQAAMLTEEVAFSCMGFIAEVADGMDDELSELLPTRPRRRSRKK